MTNQTTALIVHCNGFVEGCDFGDQDNLYMRYGFHTGPDWSVIGGVDSGLSQTAVRNIHSDQGIIWNFPIDITFKSTNVFGWPRIAFSVYGLDFLGRDVIRGYGSALIPLAVGEHTINIDMYVPLGTSTLNGFVSWLFGNPPEFFDTNFVCQSEGREVTRVQKTGTLRLIINVKTKGFEEAGYSIHDKRMQ